MLDINVTYILFPVLASILFLRFTVQGAILVTFLGGWLLLPVGHYPPIEEAQVFPWWITGLALPGEMLISKAWIPSTVAIVGALLRDAKALQRVRISILDVMVGLWCFWPLVSAYSVGNATPDPIRASLYLFGSWGTTWLLGRIWFNSVEGRVLFLKACVWAGTICLPVALLEGAGVISFYDLLYGPHPFFTDGRERYFGFRPIGLFEHGNQYGIWVACSALAAIWVAVASRQTSQKSQAFGVAALSIIIAFASQSVGAILLLIAGCLVLLLWRSFLVRILLVIGVGVCVLALGLHVSGILPLEHIARNTEFGKGLLGTFRALGRGSFLWRFSQDLKSLPIVHEHLLWGASVWDWWRPTGIRPWGLWLLLIGQFGLVGFALAYGALLVAAIKVMVRHLSSSPWAKETAALPMAVIVFMAGADSLLNAFLCFPALLAAGAIASPKIRSATSSLEKFPEATAFSPHS